MFCATFIFQTHSRADNTYFVCFVIIFGDYKIENKYKRPYNYNIKVKKEGDIMRVDYHVHTEFSDDSAYAMEQVIKDAIAMGFEEI